LPGNAECILSKLEGVVAKHKNSRYVVQVQFVEWTAENRLRHSKFLGLRSDKLAKDVGREN
jgi:ATP-dependent DNA ligase